MGNTCCSVNKNEKLENQHKYPVETKTYPENGNKTNYNAYNKTYNQAQEKKVLKEDIDEVSSKKEQEGMRLGSSVKNSNSQIGKSPHSSIRNNDTPTPTPTPYLNINYKMIETFKAHDKIIVSMIELENKKIATGSYDCSIKIWNLSNKNCDLIIKEAGRVFALLEFEPNMLLSAIDKTPDGIQDINQINPDDIMINLWDLNNHKNSIYSFKGHQLRVNSLVKCNDKFFASCSNDGDIIIWDYAFQKSVSTLRGHADCILCMIKLNDGKLCSGSADCTIKIWDWENGNCIMNLEGNSNWVKCLCQLNNENGYIISGSQDNYIKIWDKDECIKSLDGHNRSVRSICQIGNSNYIATASFDHTIKIWDLNKNICVQTLTGHLSSVIDVIYHSDGYLVSCSNDLSIKIWK